MKNNQKWVQMIPYCSTICVCVCLFLHVCSCIFFLIIIILFLKSFFFLETFFFYWFLGDDILVYICDFVYERDIKKNHLLKIPFWLFFLKDLLKRCLRAIDRKFSTDTPHFRSKGKHIYADQVCKVFLKHWV